MQKRGLGLRGLSFGVPSSEAPSVEERGEETIVENYTNLYIKNMPPAAGPA